MAQDKQLTIRSTAMMEDWASRVDRFLLADDRDILKDAGRISMEIERAIRIAYLKSTGSFRIVCMRVTLTNWRWTCENPVRVPNPARTRRM